MTGEQIYHIYPLGFSGANQSMNDGIVVKPLSDIMNIIDHLESLNVTTLLLGPIFESESHGYDTRDYKQVDSRLGSNDDLVSLVTACHEKGIKVILDCVFNHVARSHEIFLDLKNNKEQSKYKEWVKDVNFEGNSSFDDGFSYGNWDGHDILVKLNLDNGSVRLYLQNIALDWVKTYDIDGLRMDAADVMSKEFLSGLSHVVKAQKENFKFIGEVVHGDYNNWINEGKMDAVTNYEAYKGLYSSLNDKNYFEIAHTLNRQFGTGGHYSGATMYNFVDNHDVNRAASRLTEERHLYPLYIMLYTMPGIPTLYYGSEYGLKGKKMSGTDVALRPKWDDVEKEKDSNICSTIKKLSQLRAGLKPLNIGSYKQVHIEPEVIGYERDTFEQKTYIFINAKEEDVDIPVPMLYGRFVDVLNNEEIDCNGRVNIYKNWGRILVRAS